MGYNQEWRELAQVISKVGFHFLLKMFYKQWKQGAPTDFSLFQLKKISVFAFVIVFYNHNVLLLCHIIHIVSLHHFSENILVKYVFFFLFDQEIYSHNPDVKWDDIIGLDNAKRLVKEAVVYPIKVSFHFFAGIFGFGLRHHIRFEKENGVSARSAVCLLIWGNLHWLLCWNFSHFWSRNMSIIGAIQKKFMSRSRSCVLSVSSSMWTTKLVLFIWTNNDIASLVTQDFM